MKLKIFTIAIISIFTVLFITRDNNFGLPDNAKAWDEAHSEVTMITDGSCTQIVPRIDSGLAPHVRCNK